MDDVGGRIEDEPLSVMKIQYTIQNVITIGRLKINPLINCVRRELKSVLRPQIPAARGGALGMFGTNSLSDDDAGRSMIRAPAQRR